MISKSKSTGFTLMELLVCLAIIGFVMAMVFLNSNSFGVTAAKAAATEMSVDVRQAQSYGESVKQTDTGNFTTSYGISFNLSDPTAYYIFADKNSNGKYDGDTSCSTGTECVRKNQLQNGVSIASFCATVTGGSETCPAPSVQSISILFKRPDPTADIYTFDSLGSSIPNSDSAVRIILKSSSGGQSSVGVSKIGQVFIK